MTTTNPGGQPYGYNLSVRVVLPAGVAYGGGAEIEPLQIGDRPATGETTLIFRNIRDLSPGSSHDLGLRLSYDTARYDVGDTLDVEARSYVDDAPRNVPLFDADGVVTGGFTGSAGPVVGTATITALEVEKSEPSREGELLRGVHDHQTVYTVSVANNAVRATTGARLVDYLPAGLEFLGCGGPGADRTTDAPTNPGSAEEYPGSGPIVVPALVPCTAPASVETVQADPDAGGPLPLAVYTRVEWALGTLAPGDTVERAYRAAIPMRENTLTWSDGEPAVTGAQAANLDNNGGAEPRDEQALTNFATAAGDYDGVLPVTDGFALTRTAEDWVVHKAADGDELVQGAITTWTLTFASSEYRSVRDATITDTLPDGLCPLGPVNYTGDRDATDAECDPVAGLDLTAPYTSATEQADGTWLLTWDATDFPALAQTRVNAGFELRFPSRTRASYQSGFLPTTPILTRDTVRNDVETEATAVVRCLAPGTPDCVLTGPEIDSDAGNGTGTSVVDASSASQLAGSPTILKRVAASGTDCRLATYVTSTPVYHPGDTVCWNLRVDFPVGVDTSPQTIRDFLPSGAIYDGGSDAELNAPEGGNDLTATLDDSGAATDGVLEWTIDGGDVPRGARVFERTFSSVVGLGGGRAEDGEIVGNLMKFSSVNTESVSEPLRDQRDIVLEVPVVDLRKGVQRVARAGRSALGPFGIDQDHRLVQGGDTVTYRVDLTNDGGQDAVDVEVWDVLPAEYDCLLPGISNVSDGGVCVDGGLGPDRIQWSVASLPVGATPTLTYDAVVPAAIGPSRTLLNRAGVRAYAGLTNTGTNFPYAPVDNIDATATRPADQNAPAADDGSDVYTSDGRIAKSATTSVVDVNGNGAAQATIGETIAYTVTATIPAGTTVSGATISDTVDAVTRQLYVAGSASATLDGAALPAGFTLDDSGPVPRLAFPTDFAVPSGGADGVVVLTFSMRVADVAANTRLTTRTLDNYANLSYIDDIGTMHSRSSTIVRSTVVEPLIAQTKSDDRNPDLVTPGTIVTYRLMTSNSAAGRVSTAHDVLVVDTLPRGLTPIAAAPGNLPLADGDAVPGVPGSRWDASARTIARTIATLLPGGRDLVSYRARVDDPAIGGAQLTNRVAASAASLPAGAPGRRTSGTGYAASAQDTLLIEGPTLTKSVTPAAATIGDRVAYELLVTIPADLSLFDVTVADVLPDGIAFDDYGSATCVSGCAPFNPVATYDPVAGGAGTTTIAWDLGDVPVALPTPQVVRLTYGGWVRDRYLAGARANVVRGATLVNTARVGSNRTDLVGAFDPARVPTGLEYSSDPATASVRTVEPRVGIVKQVDVDAGGTFADGPATALANARPTYALTVRNSGDVPAYDIVVTDTPDGELTDVVAGTLPSGVTLTKAWEAADREQRWLIAGPIAPGASVRLTYGARLVAASGLRDGQAIDNTAAVPSYFGAPSATREDPGNAAIVYRDHRDGGSDSVRLLLDFPTLTLVKTTGIGAGPAYPETGTAEVGQPYRWRVTVSNTSAAADAQDVEVLDVLPENWSYVSGSTVFSTGERDDPAVSADAAGDRLTWTVARLAAGRAVTIAFDATPSVAAVRSPGLGAEAHVNVAEVTAARDVAGNSGDGDGAYAAAADDASATLALPALSIAKTPDGGTATAGSASSFAIEISNSGPVAARDLVIEDVLPAGLRYTEDSATAAPSSGFSERSASAGPARGETTIVWDVASLAAGASVTITVPVAVDADVLAGETLTNTASVRSAELPDPIDDGGDLDVEALADMAIEKSGPARYTAGTDHTWRLRVRNLGPSDAQAVAVSDPLPAGTTLVSADAPCALSAGAVSCALGTAAAGFDRTYEVTVAVDADALGTLANVASVSTTTRDADPANDSSRSDAAPDPLADVTVTKTASPDAVPRGAQSTFTMTVSNRGPSVARDVELIDALPAGLDFLAVRGSGCTQLAGTVTCLLGDLAVGATTSVDITVTATGNGAFDNVATVSTTTPEPAGGGDPDSAEAELLVGPVAELAIEKTGPATVAAGGQVTWQLEIVNNGPDPATGVIATDTLPAGTTFVSASPGCVAADGVVTCAIGDLAVGASAVRELTASVPVALGSTTLVNAASARGNEIDLFPSDDRDEAVTTVGPSSDLALVKTGPAEATAGGTVAWTLVARNDGPSAATGVVVSDTLPAGVGFVSATPSQGGCGVAGQVVRCELGGLVDGGAAQIQVVGRLAAGLAGTSIVNRATVGGAEPDPDPADDSGAAPTRIVSPPPADPPAAVDRSFDVALSKGVAGTVRPVVGDAFSYTLEAVNSGPGTATGVTITDALPRALVPLSARLPGGRCTRRGRLVTCAIASLAPGAGVRVALRVRAVAAGAAIRNVASVRADVADRDARNDRATATVAVAAPRAALRLDKRVVGSGRLVPGAAVRFAIRVTNPSRQAAGGVLVCDRVPEQLSLASTGGGRLRRGDLCWTVGVLPARASRTFAVTMRVNRDVRTRAVRNVARVTADNAPGRRASARVTVVGPLGGTLPSAGRGGGVTG